jgi:hypothetical protein
MQVVFLVLSQVFSMATGRINEIGLLLRSKEFEWLFQLIRFVPGRGGIQLLPIYFEFPPIHLF